MIDWDDTGWTKPDGTPVGDYWRSIRGAPGAALRVVYEVPRREGFAVGDIRIGGRPITIGGQLAEHVVMSRPRRRRSERAVNADGAAAALAPAGADDCRQGAALPSGVELPGSGAASRTARRDAAAAAPRPTSAGAGRRRADEPVVRRARPRPTSRATSSPGSTRTTSTSCSSASATSTTPARGCAWLAPRLTTMDEVLDFRARVPRRCACASACASPTLTATWITSRSPTPAIAALAGERTRRAFGEQSFRQGLAARSTYLGDPTDPTHRGHRDNWVVGRPATTRPTPS